MVNLQRLIMRRNLSMPLILLAYMVMMVIAPVYLLAGKATANTLAIIAIVIFSIGLVIRLVELRGRTPSNNRLPDRIVGNAAGKERTKPVLIRVWSFLKEKIEYFIIIAISFHALIWFQEGVLFICGDAILPFHAVDELFRILSPWDPTVDLGVINVELPRLPFFLFFAAAEALGINLITAEKAYFVLVRALSGVVACYTFSVLLENVKSPLKRMACFLGALIYMFNPFIMLFIRKFLLALSYALLPLPLAFFIKGMRTNERKYVWFFAISLYGLFICFPGYEWGLLAIFIIACYAVFYAIMRELSLAKAVKFVAKGCLIFALLNSWWIVLMIYNMHGMFLALEAVPVTFDKENIMVEVLRWLGHWSFYTTSRIGKPLYPYSWVYTEVPTMIVLTFVPPLLAFLALLLRPRSKLVTCAALSLVISLFISKGANAPLGEVFAWIVINIPLLKCYRTPTMTFMAATSLFYTILLVATFMSLYERLPLLLSRLGSFLGHKKLSTPSLKRVGGLTILALFAGLMICECWPLLTGDVIFNWYEPTLRGVIMPDWYEQVNELIGQGTSYGAIFILPQTGTYIANTWGYAGINPYRLLFTRPVVTGTGGCYAQSLAREQIWTLYDIFYANETRKFGTLIGMMGIEYVILDKSVKEVWGIPKLYSPEETEVLLDAQPELEKVKKVGELTIYKNKALFPIAYARRKAIIISATPEEPEGIGWADDAFLSSWQVSELLPRKVYENTTYEPMSFTSDGDIAYLKLESHGQYIYSYIWRDVSINPLDYPFFIIRYRVNDFSSLVVGVVTADKQKSCTLFIFPHRVRKEKYLRSREWAIAVCDLRYTLLYHYPELAGANITSIRLSLTNAPKHQDYVGTLEAWIDYVMFASRIGSYYEIVRLMEAGSFDPEHEAIIFLNRQPEPKSSLTTIVQDLNRVASSKPVDIDVLEVGRSYARIKVRNEGGPFILIFTQAYDPGWSLKIHGRKTGIHVAINGILNGWILYEEGEFEVLIEHEGVYAEIVGLTITIGGIVIIACILLRRYRIRRKHIVQKNHIS